MKLPWRDSRETPAAPETPPPPVGQSCPTLSRAIDSISRRERPTVLDLGPMCGDTVVYFGSRGARVTVADFEPPPVAPPGSDDDAAPTPIRLDHADGSYDLVIAWEWFDFVAPDQVDAFCSEMHRVLKDDGWLLMFSLNQAPPEAGDRPRRYRVVADDKLVREAPDGPMRPRRQYPTRRIESALQPLSVQTLHLQRNQIREFLAHKPGPKAKRTPREDS